MLFIAGLLAPCALAPEEIALLPRRHAFTSPLYLPIAADSPNTATSPKKGVYLGPGSCDLLRALGASWYYAGRECDGLDWLPYLENARAFDLATEAKPPAAAYVLFWNEPDLAHWNQPPIEELVSGLVEMEAKWTEKVWIGPCLSGDAEYLRAFWTEYERQAGHPPDPETHRLCLHCYAEAETCLQQIDNHLSTGAEFGLDRLWLTEFGIPLGLCYSIEDARRENARLVQAMEADPRVERYAYWAALITSYGYLVPSKPISGFHPLAFYWLRKDGTKEERLTDMGEWYAGAPEPCPKPCEGACPEQSEGDSEGN